MINPDGKVFFIDFDGAKLKPSKRQQKREHSRLDCLLLGARETADRSAGSSAYYSGGWHWQPSPPREVVKKPNLWVVEQSRSQL